METILRSVADAFRIDGKLHSWEQIKVGNVNKTYKVNFLQNNGEIKSYICQNLNLFVFKSPQQVMHNIDLVTKHIMGRNPERINLHFHHVDTGENYYVDETGFWRLFNFIESASFDICQDLSVLRNAGKAFGEFQNSLSDFDASLLFETIKNFHNTPKRLESLFFSAKKDRYDKVCEVGKELKWIDTVSSKACVIQNMLDSGALPLRVTHNDTKINNVLFDKKTYEAITVIDLDTVMPGLVGHDFGDAVRFACNFVEEDSRYDDKAGVDLDKFRALCEGFIPEISFTENEKSTLALSCFTLTLELAARFLDDYLNGSKYFRIDYPDHNLIRARCQIALAKDMLEKMDDMDKIVMECAN